MKATHSLHDSGLHYGRLLGELLHAGVVMLDGQQRCCLASPRACAHFGAPDEATLVEGWDALRAGLDLSAIAMLGVGDAPLQRRCEIHTPWGTRTLRFEVHAVDGAGTARYMMLLRECTLTDGADRARIMASECEANRHVIAGLIHDAKGPLNNLHLTLALLASAIGRMEASQQGPAELIARCHRYIDVMQAEETRLAGCLNDIHALTQRCDATRQRVDVAVLLRDVARLLRHEARIREATIEIDAPAPVWTFGDPHQLHLTLIAFCACLVDAARPMSVVTMRTDADDDTGGARIRIVGTDVAMPAGIVDTFYRISGIAASDFPSVLAGRTIVEAHGGEVELVGEGETGVGFAITFPAASRSQPSN